MEKKNTGLGIAALVLSIFAIVFCFIPYINVISYIMGGLALIFGIISLISKKAKNGLPIAAIVLSIIAFIIASTMNTATNEAIKQTSKDLDKITGDATEDVLKDDVEVTLGNFVATADEWGLESTELAVTIKNKSDKNQSFSVEIEAVDANGQRIEEDTVYVSSLNAGQTATEKAFTLVTSDKVESLKTATFKVVKASAY